MITPYVIHDADGENDTFPVPFPYLHRSHVKVFLQGVEQGSGTYSWVSSASIKFSTVPAAGTKAIRFERRTPTDPLVTYTPSAALTIEDLQTDALQALYRLEEMEATVDRALQFDFDVTGVNPILPDAVPLAPLVWNPSGTALVNGDPNITGDMLLRPQLASDDPAQGASLIAYKGEGLGAVVRSLLGRVRDLPTSALDFIPVSLHAAIRAGTSTADVTTYLQAAIDHLGGKGGGRLALGEGLFNISAKLDVPWSGVIIEGHGCGTYTADGTTTVRASARTRIAWIGTSPPAGTPMIDFRTRASRRTDARNALRDVMLDGMTVARIGLALTSYMHAAISDVFVYACVEDGFLLRTADYDLAGGAGACQFNVLSRCAVASYGGAGVYLTNSCRGIRFTGGKCGAGGANAVQNGDASCNTVYSPRFDLATGVAITFEGVGQNTVYSPQGGAWGGVTGGYDIVFGSTDQDSNWPPSGGVTHPKAATSRYNAVFYCEHAVVAKAAQNTGGGSSFGNMVWGASRGNGAPEPWVEQSLIGSIDHARLTFQTLGSQAATSRTLLGGNVEIAGRDNSSAVGPALFLHKISDAGAVNDGLAKIQWRMTNSAGTINVDAGRIDASITNATPGSETVTMGIWPNWAGNGESNPSMQWGAGFRCQLNGDSPSLSFQGFGTGNVSLGYYVKNLKVVGTRDTGWTAMTGTANKSTAYATGSITHVQLAERVKAIEDLLITHHGLAGA